MMGPDLQRFLDVQRKGKLMWHGGWLDPDDAEMNAQIRAAREAAQIILDINRASAGIRAGHKFKDISAWQIKHDREMLELCWNCRRPKFSGHAEVPISKFNYQTHLKCLFEPTWYEPVGLDALTALWDIANSIGTHYRDKDGNL